jgi:hypothetical protein
MKSASSNQLAIFAYLVLAGGCQCGGTRSRTVLDNESEERSGRLHLLSANLVNFDASVSRKSVPGIVVWETVKTANGER